MGAEVCAGVASGVGAGVGVEAVSVVSFGCGSVVAVGASGVKSGRITEVSATEVPRVIYCV